MSTPVKSDRQHSFCYIGRLSEEKGVRTLIKAAVKANVVLNIAGGGPLLEELKEKYRKNKNIHFLGHLSAEKTAELLMNSQASIMPSECYENNPLGVIESLCAGTPVIGANIGGIPELIDNESGVVYPSGDVEDLAHLDGGLCFLIGIGQAAQMLRHGADADHGLDIQHCKKKTALSEALQYAESPCRRCVPDGYSVHFLGEVGIMLRDPRACGELVMLCE